MGRVLLVLSICAAFGQIQSVDNPPTQLQISNLFAHADNFLSLFTTSLEDAIAHYLPPVVLLGEYIEAKSESKLTPARAEIQGLYAHYIRKIQQLQRTHRGKDISSCIDTYQPKLAELPGLYVEKVEQCIGQLVVQGVNFVQRSEQIIRSNANLVGRYSLRVKQCGILTDTAFECMTSTLDELTRRIIDTPNAIREDAQRAQRVITSLESQFDCYESIINEMEQIGNEISGNLEVCAINL